MDKHHVLTALVTPFHANGTIDFEAMKKIIDRLLLTSDGIVVMGTTAECCTLSKDERWMIYHFVTRYIHGRVPVYAGVGTNNTLESIMFAQMAIEAKVDGLMVVTPYYNKPQQEGLYRHFKAIASLSDLPVMLYTVPSRCGINLSSETIIRLVNDCPTIKSLKYAASDYQIVRDVLQNTKDFTVYTGEDGALLDGLLVGMQGVVSVVSHIIGEHVRKVVTDYKAGIVNIEEDVLVKEASDALFLESSPVPVKYALHRLGLCQEDVRLPLVALSQASKDTIDRWLLKT